MDEQTALVLSLQLVALCCVAVGLLLYLVCRLHGTASTAPLAAAPDGRGRAVLVTSAETALGLQCALRLSRLGYRVFAGIAPRPGVDDTHIDCIAESEDDDEDDTEQTATVTAGTTEVVPPASQSENSDAQSDADAASCEDKTPSGAHSDAAPVQRPCSRVSTKSSSSSSSPRSAVLSVLRAASKAREADGVGRLVAIPLDVTREDLLHDATDLVRAHLPAGEDGLWAVVNTSGSCCRGRLDCQQAAQWEQLLKVNVVGALRTARAFLPLLKHAKGRLVTVGASPPGAGLAATTAARYAVEGASAALRREMAPHGVAVVTLRPEPQAPGLPAEMLFSAPSFPRQIHHQGDVVVDIQPTSYKFQESDFSVLTPHAMRILEEAISSPKPKDCYQLTSHRRYPTLEGFMGVLKNKISGQKYKSQII